MAGMKRMLNTTGADDTMKRILSGDLTPDQIAALKTLVANPDKTLGECIYPNFTRETLHKPILLTR